MLQEKDSRHRNYHVLSEINHDESMHLKRYGKVFSFCVLKFNGAICLFGACLKSDASNVTQSTPLIGTTVDSHIKFRHKFAKLFNFAPFTVTLHFPSQVFNQHLV